MTGFYKKEKQTNRQIEWLTEFLNSSSGSHALWNIVVCIRVLKFVGAKLWMVAAVARISWIRHWMRTTIVSDHSLVDFDLLN